MTNISGKFAAPTSHKASDAQESVKTQSKKVVVPEVPNVTDNKNELMDEVRRLFGRFWWLWIIVLVLWLMKGD